MTSFNIIIFYYITPNFGGTTYFHYLCGTTKYTVI